MGEFFVVVVSTFDYIDYTAPLTLQHSLKDTSGRVGEPLDTVVSLLSFL